MRKTVLLEYEDLGLVKPGIFPHVVKGEKQVGAGTPGQQQSSGKQTWVVAAAAGGFEGWDKLTSAPFVTSASTKQTATL